MALKNLYDPNQKIFTEKTKFQSFISLKTIILQKGNEIPTTITTKTINQGMINRLLITSLEEVSKNHCDFMFPMD